VSIAREEFGSHGIGKFVSVEQRDVCEDGFGTELHGKADAMFLDIPHPWEVVPHAAAAFKDLGKLNCTCLLKCFQRDCHMCLLQM
jgi:tRNA (adenine57-N1/adenine58-N1)-methyltransferase